MERIIDGYFKKGNEAEGKELWFKGILRKGRKGKLYFKVDSLPEVTGEIENKEESNEKDRSVILDADAFAV